MKTARRDGGLQFAVRAIPPSGAMLCLLFAVLVWPVIAWQGGGTGQAGDQWEFHEPTIRAIALHWPSIQLAEYHSATAPGYHLVLATVGRWMDDHTITLQVAGSLFGFGLLLAVFVPVSRRVGGWGALALLLPLVCSKYVLGSAIWLTTDNAALLFVWLALSGAVLHEPTPRRVALWSLWATLAVSVRQIHLWVAAPVWLAALRISPWGEWIGRLLEDTRRPRCRWTQWLPMVPALAGPLVVLAALLASWGGLVPPLFAGEHSAGQNPATLLLALSLVGGFGVFFVGAFASWRDLTRWDRSTCLALLAGLFVSLLWPSQHNVEAGRWGGPIWEVVRCLPAVGGRSLALVPLAGLGAVVLHLAWRELRRAGRTAEAAVLFLSLLGWVVAQSVNSQAWQRYCEPMVLIGLILVTVLCRSGRRPQGERQGRSESPHGGSTAEAAWWVGPLLLGGVQFSVSLLTVYWPAWHESLGPLAPWG